MWRSETSPHPNVIAMSGPPTGRAYRFEVRAQHLSTITQPVEIVRPVLHHFNALVPIFAARISPSDLIGIHVSKLALDRVGIPLPHSVEQRGNHRPEAVRGHLVGRVAELAQTLVYGILGHRLAWLAEARKQVFPPVRVLVQLLEHCDHLPRQRHAVRSSHLHPLRWDEPDRLVQIDVGPLCLPQFAWAQQAHAATGA